MPRTQMSAFFISSSWFLSEMPTLRRMRDECVLLKNRKNSSWDQGSRKILHDDPPHCNTHFYPKSASSPENEYLLCPDAATDTICARIANPKISFVICGESSSREVFEGSISLSESNSCCICTRQVQCTNI